MCNKAFDTCLFAFDSVPEAVSKEHFTLKFCLDRYRAELIPDQAVDTFLPTSKFVSDRFVTNRILEKT